MTASTSIEPRSGGTPGPAPLESEAIIWDVEEARMMGKRRGGKERVGDGRWLVWWWWWKVVCGGVKSWRWRRETDIVTVVR